MKQFVVTVAISLLLSACRTIPSRSTYTVVEYLFGESEEYSDEYKVVYSAIAEVIEEQFSIEERKIMFDVLSDEDVRSAYHKVLDEDTYENRLQLHRIVQQKGACEIFERFASSSFQEELIQKNMEVLRSLE